MAEVSVPRHVATRGLTAIVAGGNGVVGRAIIQQLCAAGGWQVYSLSRRRPNFGLPAEHISVDLADAADCAKQLQGLGDATHVFYAAYAPDQDLGREAALNGQMLINLVEALEPLAPQLQHIQLMQGSKWYGNHLGPYRTPAKEDDPRHIQPCFYYNQQDWLIARQHGRSWTWSGLRPHGVLGLAVGSSMNQLTAMALYAVISKEQGRKLCWPGTEGAFNSIYQFTEAAYLARGMEWAATSANASNQAFNFTNGDLVRWCHLWPAIARAFDMDPGPPTPMPLAVEMATKESIWADICKRHDLKRYRLTDLTNWTFADFVFGCGYDQISDLTRLRGAGWNDVNPSEPMYVRLIADLRNASIIP
ncbi:MAG: SDR family oxidoreductase [Hyphomicrobiaceae bacterium]